MEDDEPSSRQERVRRGTVLKRAIQFFIVFSIVAVAVAGLAGTAVGELTLAADGTIDTESQEGETDWHEYQAGIENIGTNDATGPASDPSTAWSVPLEDDVTASPVVVDDTVYIGSESGGLHGLDADSGAQVWEFDTESDITASAAVHDGTVYVGNADAVYAVDGATGDEEWNTTTDSSIEAPPTVTDGTVYVGSDDGTVYAIDVDTGDTEWSTDIDGPVKTAPAFADDTVFVGTSDDDGHVYALDSTDDGAQQWQFEVHEEVRAAPTVVDDTVYLVGGGDFSAGYVYAVPTDPEWDEGTYDEDEHWQFEEDRISASVAVADGTVYVGTQRAGRGLYALDAEEGTTKWDVGFEDDIETSPAVADGAVYVGDNEGVVHAVETDGTEGWSYELDGEITSPAVANERVYVGTNRHGHVYAIEAELTVNGTITDGDGEPVDDVLVSLNDTEETISETRTNEDGEYTLHPPSGDYDLSAERFGIETEIRDLDPLGPGDATTADVEVTRQTPGVIEGTVFEPDGKTSVDDGSVTLYADRARTSEIASADLGDGSYEFDDLDPGETYYLTVAGGVDHPDARDGRTVEPDTTHVVDFVLNTDWQFFGENRANTGVNVGSGPVDTVGQEWRFHGGDEVVGSPVVVDDTVYVTRTGVDGEKNGLFALDTDNGSTEWEYRTDDSLYSIDSTPAVADGLVYFGTRNNDDRIVAVDAADGSFVWDRELDSTVYGYPVVYDGLLVYATESFSDNPTVHARNAETGEWVWGYETERNVPVRQRSQTGPSSSPTLVRIRDSQRSTWSPVNANGSLRSGVLILHRLWSMGPSTSELGTISSTQLTLKTEPRSGHSKPKEPSMAPQRSLTARSM